MMILISNLFPYTTLFRSDPWHPGPRRGIMLKAEDNLLEVPLMVHLSDIHSVTDFQRNTKDHLKRLEKSRRPLVLTLDRKSTRLNSSPANISYAVYALKKN